MPTHNEVIEDLVSTILMQEEEIKKLKSKIVRIKQYLEVYEDYLEGMDR